LEILSFCPFPAAAMVWQHRPGEWKVSVCVKVSFQLVHGEEAVLAAAQAATSEDAHWDADPSASLRAPSDFVPYKPRVDVLVVGHAYVPGGALANSLVARVRVGDLRKSLSVTGDRAWGLGQGGLQPGQAAPFQRMPLRYERAAVSADNPIGVDADPARAVCGKPLPNIAAAPGAAEVAGGRAATPGFGPIHPMWRARRDHAADADVLWAYRMRLSKDPAPDNFDFGFFNSAPPDQQMAELPPEVLIALEGLSPKHARLESRLPPHRVRLFRVRPGSGQVSAIEARRDTLIIDTDRSLAVVSWRGVEAIEGKDEQSVGMVVIAAEAGNERISVEDIERLLRELAQEVRYVDKAALEVSAASSPRPAVPVEPPSVRPSAPPSAPPSVPKKIVFGPPPPKQAPFNAPKGALSTIPARTSQPAGAALPFRPSAPAVTAPSAPSGPSAFFDPPPPPPSSPPQMSSTPTFVLAPPPDIAASMLEPVQPTPEPAPFGPAPPSLSASAPPSGVQAPSEVAPPLMLAPLFSRESSPPPLEPIAASAASSAITGNGEVKAAPPAEAVDISIERCAAIAAELAERREPRAEVLRKHALTEQAFTAVERKWAESIEKDAARGPSPLLHAYDAAYVAAIEAIRGRILPLEYAKLVLGIEQGHAAEVLAELRIQRSAMMRVKRVWSKRMAEDASLKGEVSRALEGLQKR
jgi:hypothetical protein